MEGLPARTTSTAAATTVPTAATTAAGAVSATSTEAPASAATTTLGLRTSFIDIQSATAQLRSVERVNGSFRFAAVRHFNESKAARLPGVTIRNYIYAVDSTVGLESCT